MNNWLIRGGSVYDGAGGAPFRADVLVTGGMIKKIAPTIRADVPVLEAAGRAVAPGFIDAHRHMDAALLRTPGYGEVELRQGITTALCGNCGFSLHPCGLEHQKELFSFLAPIVGSLAGLSTYESLPQYLETVENSLPAIHVGALLGNGTVRIGLNGYSSAPMPPPMLAQAAARIRQAQRDGAFGLSLGLMYAPENAYQKDELIELAKAMDGGLLVAHIRGEGKSLVKSAAEVIDVARQSGARLQISHFKAAGRPVWGEPFQRAMALVDQAACQGVDVACDAYPYSAGSTSLLTLLPPKWLHGGVDALAERVKSQAARAELREILAREQDDFDNIVAGNGWDSFVISSVLSAENRWLLGKSIALAARESGGDEIELICDLIAGERGNVGIINHIISAENLKTVLRWDKTTLISDSVLPDGLPHPRYHGTFARFLRMTREEGLMPLQSAVRRMSGAVADRYGIQKRGYLKPGFHADIAVFNPQTVTDTATYKSPVSLATGFDYVLTGGTLAVRHDCYTGARTGKVLRH